MAEKITRPDSTTAAINFICSDLMEQADNLRRAHDELGIDPADLISLRIEVAFRKRASEANQPSLFPKGAFQSE